MAIRPDGQLYVHTGVGNLGTHSVIDLARVAAEMLQMPWDRVEVIWGDTSKHLPWSPHVGRQPDDACRDARQSRGGARREAQAAGDRRAGSRRGARRLRARTGTRVPSRESGSRTQLRSRRRNGRWSSAASSTATSCRRRFTPSRESRRGARRPRPDGRRQGHVPARRRHVFIHRRLRRGRSRYRNGRRPRSSTISASAMSAPW